MMFPGISEYLIIKKRFHKAVGRNYASATGRGDRSDPIGIMLDEGDELSVFQPGSPDVAGANIATSFYPGILVHWSRLQCWSFSNSGSSVAAGGGFCGGGCA